MAETLAIEPYNRIEISQSALNANVDLFTDLGGKPVIPILRANAYGHGIEQVATALDGRTDDEIPYVAVNSYVEACRVQTVSNRRVLILGDIRPDDLRRIPYEGLAFCARTPSTIQALGESGRPADLHLEMDVGLNRHGVTLDQIPETVRLIRSFSNLNLVGVLGHVTKAADESPGFLNRQVSMFDAGVEAARAAGAEPQYIHIAKTAAVLRANSQYANTTRVGEGLYGLNPFPADHRLHRALRLLRPVMEYISTIVETRELDNGDHVGYDYTFTAPHSMRIGVLPAGHYDGVDPALGNGGVVKLKNDHVFAGIVGRICVNDTMIDITDIDVDEGEEVIVYSSLPSDPNSFESMMNSSRHVGAPFIAPNPNLKWILVP